MLLALSQRADMVVPEKREIPEDMKSYLVSPIRLIPEFSLETTDKMTLTKDYFLGKWSFVYFSHSQCLPQCSAVLNTMQDLKQAFGDRLFNYLLIDIDEQEHSNDFDEMLQFQGYDHFTVASSDPDTIEILARAFIALFLKTPLADNDYMIEQEHMLFAVDPQGRVYAQFKPSYESNDIQALFLKMRFFYNKTE